MYLTLNEVTATAQRMNMAIGAFNTHNLEMLPSIIRSARDLGSPVIIQTSVGTAQYIGYNVLVAVCKRIAEDEAVDVVLHLDHCTEFKHIKEAIDAGYSSVMFDGSSLPFKENQLKTKAIVDYAHERGVSVEGEIGIIGGSEDGVSSATGRVLTNPKDAKEFAEFTNVDALAIAIGTTHGSYKGKTDVDIELLKQIKEIVETPLVIHGGTGVKEEDYPQLINNGIRKFNVGTELLVNWTQEAKNAFSETSVDRSLRYNMIPPNEKVYDIVKHKISLFMNAN